MLSTVSRSSRRRSLRLLAAAAVIALGSVPAAAFQSEGTVRIGLLEAQTGTPATYGIQGLVGAQIAVDEINAAGGVMVDGQMVKLAVTPAPSGYDPGGDSATTIALVKKLVAEDQVLAIKGTSRSANTEAAFNYLNELEAQGSALVLLSSASASPGLGKLTTWGFRNSFFESNSLVRVINAMKALGYKTAGIYVSKDNAFNATVAEKLITPALKAAGFEIVVVTEGLEKDTDYSAAVEALRQANPDIVAVSTPVLPGINVMKEAARRGFRPKAWIGTIGNIAPEVPAVGGAATERMVVGSSYAPSLPAVQALAEEYKKRTGNDLNMFGVNGYEAIYLFKAAIEASGIKNTPETLQDDRVKFRDALAKVELQSITGEMVKFNDEHDAIKQGFLLTIKDGQYVIWDEKPFE